MQKVLFVDDELNVLKSMKRIVRAHGLDCTPLYVTSAPEALKMLETEEVDIIVSDIRMPEMNGIDFLTRLKANPKTQYIPTLVLTAELDTSVRNVALELGAWDFLNKPVEPIELVARLRNTLRIKAFQDELRNQSMALEKQLLMSQKMEVAGLLASSAAHDMRNILAAIIGSAELALRDPQNDKVEKNLNRIMNSAEKAVAISNQILSLARMESQGTNQIDANKAVGQALEIISPLIPDDVKLNWQPPENDIYIKCDQTSFIQVLSNLTINAVQAMGKSGELSIKLECPIHVNTDDVFENYPKKPICELRVTDTGPGFDEETADKIFAPFFTTKKEGVGTGLGLSVVKRITEKYGGYAKAKSKPGQGTTFIIGFEKIPQSAHSIEEVPA